MVIYTVSCASPRRTEEWLRWCSASALGEKSAEETMCSERVWLFTVLVSSLAGVESGKCCRFIEQRAFSPVGCCCGQRGCFLLSGDNGERGGRAGRDVRRERWIVYKQLSGISLGDKWIDFQRVVLLDVAQGDISGTPPGVRGLIEFVGFFGFV